MSRILKRPLFRMGGSSYSGIMHGLVDRKGYSNGDIVERAGELIPGFEELLTEYTPKTRLPIGMLGANLVAGMPFSEAVQDPYKSFVSADDARRAGIKTGAAKIGIQQALSEAKPSDKRSQIALKAREAFGNPNIINPVTGKPFASYGEAYTYFSMGMSDPAKMSEQGRVISTTKDYMGVYGNKIQAQTHAIAIEVIAPMLSEAGKNFTGKRIKRGPDGYKKPKLPGVYVDVDNKVMVEFDGNQLIPLPEYSKFFQ